MKRFFFVLLLFGSLGMLAQQQPERLLLRKGVVMDSLPVRDSVASELKLYLPSSFETSRRWPLIFICVENGMSIQAMRFMSEAAEKNGYILATSDTVKDTVSLTDKVLRINKRLELLNGYLPIDVNRIYAAGYDLGGQLASLVPALIQPVRGVLSIGSNMPTLELIKTKGPYEFVGIMGRSDYLYSDMLAVEEVLDQKQVSNYVFYHTAGHQWPEKQFIDFGMQALSLMAMKDRNAAKDTLFIQNSLRDYQDYITGLVSRGELLLAMDQVEEGLALYDGLADTDWLKDKQRELRRNRAYKNQKRDWEQVRLQEDFLIEDYTFYLGEDVETFNLNNLGWWNHQMGRINTLKNSAKKEEQLLGERLDGYVNALVGDYIIAYGAGSKPDDDALIFLYMLKTITAPTEYDNYLKVISYTAKYGDFGTANFYLEELLKRGYKDADQLYSLPETGLLRISPEYNKLIEQYLGQARYATED